MKAQTAMSPHSALVSVLRLVSIDQMRSAKTTPRNTIVNISVSSGDDASPCSMQSRGSFRLCLCKCVPQASHLAMHSVEVRLVDREHGEQ